MFKFALPLLAFVLLGFLLAAGLKIDPSEIPSPFIGKEAPAFNVSQLSDPAATISDKDMRGKVWVLNVWASWCVSCRAEHEVVKKFAKSSGIDVLGLNYKDEPEDAKAWLQQFGNPYSVIAVDYDGAVGLDWGVYGVPESFVVDKQGIVRHKFTGPIDDKAVEEVLLPLVNELKGLS